MKLDWLSCCMSGQWADGQFLGVEGPREDSGREGEARLDEAALQV